jgi:hypothetical protein
MKRGSTLAELLVCLAVVATGAVIFWPRGEVDAGAYGLDVFVGVVAVGAAIGATISASIFWRRPLLTFAGVIGAAAAGGAVGWVAIMHGFMFMAGLGVLCAAWFVYLIVYYRRVEE